MMTDRKDPQDPMVDALLADVAQQHAVPDDALMARVLADAARVQTSSVTVRRPGWIAQLRDALGGWPAMGGVALAGVAGLWVGIAPPVAVDELAATVLGTAETVQFAEDTSWLFAEELSDG